MIAANINGRELKIVFKHNRFEYLDVNKKPRVVPVPIPGTHTAFARAATIAVILEGPYRQEETVASGVAYCSVLDNFSLEAGRQIALKRALADSRLTREEQGTVLSAYFNRRRTAGKEVAPESVNG